ncbi:hypothetical protein BC952_2216 [Flavobacterium limicola]|uniref:Uncharacterized protein n=1 Tax=Flavobacterium limicola TaxID=180441 RepID=A0A495RZL8_9FLAO|nr:hypothetical protein BC952_2216 [Flavobacterium limicola]
MIKFALKTYRILFQAHCLSSYKPILFTYMITYLNSYDLYVYFFYNALK